MKRIEDVTRKEWAQLALAAIDLLSFSRLEWWLAGSASEDGDTSTIEVMARMNTALAAVGLPQGTQAEFEVRLEALLASGALPASADAPDPADDAVDPHDGDTTG